MPNVVGAYELGDVAKALIMTYFSFFLHLSNCRNLSVWSN